MPLTLDGFPQRAVSMTESSATRPRLPRLQPSSKVPTLVGTLVALIGLLNLATGIIPKLRHSKVHVLAGYLPGTVTSIALAASIIIGILLLMLAHGLKRRKRRAWRTAVVLLPASLVIDALHHRGGIAHIILTVALFV